MVDPYGVCPAGLLRQTRCSNDTVRFARHAFKPNATLTEPLNNYINRDEPDFSWFDSGIKFPTVYGTAHRLNITSLKWLNDTVYKVGGRKGLDGSVWNHEVMVIVPRNLEFTNVSTLYLASAAARCNRGCHGQPAGKARLWGGGHSEASNRGR